MERPLYLITDGGDLRQRGQLDYTLTKLLETHGERVFAVLFREQVSKQNSASDYELLSLAESLRALAAARGVKLLISRNRPLASAGVFDGLHLSSERGVPSFKELNELRPELPMGKQPTLGYSAHSVAEVGEAERAGFDYAFLSPIFSPISKEDSRTPLGAAVFESLAGVSIPVFALGGVAKSNAAECRRSGATGVASIGSIFGAQDPLAAAAGILSEWDSASELSTNSSIA